MQYQYYVLEVSIANWQEIMDSDEEDEANQHLNHWGEKGWDIDCIVPKLENGTTISYGIVFRRELE